MAKRQIKDALVNGESVYFKGHAQATYMSSGITVEDAINNVGANIDLTNYATKIYVDNALVDKQNIIADLETIRSNAALGNTAVLPEAISDMETKTNAAATYATKTELENKQDQNLYFTNVAASSWVSDSTYPDYPYRCDLACSGVTEDMYADVIFSVEQANSGNYAPICETGTDIVSIWSSNDINITVLTIIAIEV